MRLPKLFGIAVFVLLTGGVFDHARSASLKPVVIHLWEIQMPDGKADIPLKDWTVYVLLQPSREGGPQVFKTFDSKPMEEAISALPRGSILFFDGNPLLVRPSPAQIQAVMTFCHKKGIKFEVGATS